MAGTDDKGLVLGAQTPVPAQYAPEILHPIPRALGRAELPGQGSAAAQGVDVWHAYELSWLQPGGRPVARVGRFSVPANSPNIVESKSFKLYLNSLNHHQFAHDDEAVATIVADISAAAGEAVSLELFELDDPALAGASLPGTCIDSAEPRTIAARPDAVPLQVDTNTEVEETLYSHLMRSLCPVTGQPDWATVWLSYRGPAIDHGSLLSHVLAFREHQEFHEQCVERLFCSVLERAQPQSLTVQALYTRRGGLDINPFRTTEPQAVPLPRMNRQ